MVWNSDLIEALELENLLINATITVTSAEQRTVRAASSPCPHAFHSSSKPELLAQIFPGICINFTVKVGPPQS